MAATRVTGSIAPIKAEDLRISVQVDPQHPITKAFLERLPRTADGDLPLLLTHLRNGPDNADTRSWIALVEGEIAFRKTEPKTLIQMISSAMNKLVS
jgi:hypothetical protein